MDRALSVAGILLGLLSLFVAVKSCHFSEGVDKRVTEVEARSVFIRALTLLGAKSDDVDAINLVLGDSEEDNEVSLRRAPEVLKLIRELEVLRPDSREVDLLKLGYAITIADLAGAEEILRQTKNDAGEALTDSEVFQMLGQAAWARFRMSVAAEKYFQRALQADPDGAGPLVSYALFLHGAGRNAEAVKSIRLAIEKEPKSVDIRNAYAHILIEGGSPEDGLNVLREAVDLGIADGSTFNHMAGALQLLGRRNEAIFFVRQAIESEPLNRSYQENLALILEQTGREQEAATVRERAQRLPPVSHDATVGELRSHRPGSASAGGPD